MEAKQFFNTWKNIFGNWRYSLLALLIAVLFYSLNVLISGWKSLAGFYSVSGFAKALYLFFAFFVGFMHTITPSSFISLIVISLMIGILFSMLVYKSYFNISYSDRKTTLIGSVGIFLAAFIPGCASCGIGFASVLGLGAGVLAALPYRGIEISALAIIILGIAIFKTTKNMYVCMVSLSKSKALNKKNTIKGK